jgi:predicted permease
LQERLSQLPGLEAAGLSSLTPFSGGVSNNPMLAEGYEMARGESIVTVNHVSVSDHYFETLGARLVAGRWFDAGDAEGRRKVIVIDDRVARKFFPDGNAVGRRMWPLRGTERMFAPPPDDQMLTVIGVVAEMRLTDVVDDPGTRTNGTCYYPFRQRASRVVGLAIRTIGEPTMITGTLRRAVAELDPEMPLHQVQPVDSLIDHSLIDRRTPAVVAAGFASVALLLATLGVYGVLAYHVSQRTREFGIRMALGADSRRIFRLVLSDGGLIVGIGLLAGFAGAILAGRSIESQLYGVSAFDPGVLAAVVGTIVLVALLAISIPARRAARTEPTVALTDV